MKDLQSILLFKFGFASEKWWSDLFGQVWIWIPIPTLTDFLTIMFQKTNKQLVLTVTNNYSDCFKQTIFATIDWLVTLFGEIVKSVAFVETCGSGD